MRTLQIVALSLIFTTVAHADPVDLAYCRAAVAKVMDGDPLASSAQSYFSWGFPSQSSTEKTVSAADGSVHTVSYDLTITAGPNSYLVSRSQTTPFGSKTDALQLQVFNKVCVPVRLDKSQNGDLFDLKKRGELKHETSSDFGDLSKNMADDPRLRAKVDFTHCNQAISAANPDRQLPSYATTYLNYGSQGIKSQLMETKMIVHNHNPFASPGIVDYKSDVAPNGQLRDLTLYNYEKRGDPKSSREKLDISYDPESDTYIATDILARAGVSDTTSVRMLVSNGVCVPVEVARNSYPANESKDLRIADCQGSSSDECQKIFGEVAKDQRVNSRSLAELAPQNPEFAQQTP